MAELLPDEDLLIRYLDNELSPEEKTAFEKMMEADLRIATRLKELSLAKDAVLYYGIREQVTAVRQAWEQSRLDVMQPSKAKVIPMKPFLRYGAIAASIIIAVFVVRGLIGTQVTPEKIYDQTYVSYDISSTRSSKTAVSKIEDAYQLKNFRNVVALAKQGPVTAKEQLLMGIAYLELNDPVAAVAPLKELAAQTELPYHQDAEFYLALAYTRNEQYANALEVFKKIRADSAHPYHGQVHEEVIEEIKGLL